MLALVMVTIPAGRGFNGGDGERQVVLGPSLRTKKLDSSIRKIIREKRDEIKGKRGGKNKKRKREGKKIKNGRYGGQG